MRKLPRTPRRRYMVASIPLLCMLALIFTLAATAGATSLRSGDSPKKGLIAFVGLRSGVRQLYTVKADGSQLRQLTFDSGGFGPLGLRRGPRGRRTANVS